MATITGTRDNFNTLVLRTPLMIVDFWAEGCGPCQRFGPTFEAASERHKDVVFVKVDTDAQSALSTAYEISSVPTLMVFRDQMIVFERSGAIAGTSIDELLAYVRKLDMAEVKRKTAEHEARVKVAAAGGKN